MVALRRTMLTLFFVGLSLALAGSTAFARAQTKAADIYRVGDWTTFEAKWLIGHEVLGSAGAKLGKISDLVIDQGNGRIALVVLSGVPGLGKKLLPIPFRALTRTGENSFTVGFRERELTDLPATSGIYRVPAQIDPAWVASIYARYGQDAYWTQPGQKPLSSEGLYRAGRLLGADLRTSAGQKMARADDLVINSRDGHIAFLSLSGVRGKGNALVAVPFNLAAEEGRDFFVLHMTRQRLANAPSFYKYADMGSRQYAQDVYEYYGLEPYWTE